MVKIKTLFPVKANPISDGFLETTNKATSLLTNNSYALVNVDAAKSILLTVLEVNVDCLVRVYSSTIYREADKNRAVGASSSGVVGLVGEYEFNGETIKTFTPAIAISNLNTPQNDFLAIQVFNLSGSAATINVQISFVRISSIDPVSKLVSGEGASTNQSFSTPVAINSTNKISFTIPLSKTCFISKIKSDRNCRVRLYSNNADALIDFNRANGAPAVNIRGLLFDIALTANQEYVFNSALSLVNLDAPQNNNYTAVVFNNEAATVVVKLTFSFTKVDSSASEVIKEGSNSITWDSEVVASENLNSTLLNTNNIGLVSQKRNAFVLQGNKDIWFTSSSSNIGTLIAARLNFYPLSASNDANVPFGQLLIHSYDTDNILSQVRTSRVGPNMFTWDVSLQPSVLNPGLSEIRIRNTSSTYGTVDYSWIVDVDFFTTAQGANNDPNWVQLKVI